MEYKYYLYTSKNEFMENSNLVNIEKILGVMRRDVARHYKVITGYSYTDYVEMKDDLGWVNKDIADIVGFEHMSVKNQTQPKYDLPLWAQLLVHLWKQENEGQLGRKDVKKEVVQNLEKFKKGFRDSQESVTELSKKVTYLEKELRKAERKEIQRLKLIKQLDELERETILDTNKGDMTEATFKNQLGKVASKHRRKVVILDKLEATIDKKERGIAKGKLKGITKPTRKSTNKIIKPKSRVKSK